MQTSSTSHYPNKTSDAISTATLRVSAELSHYSNETFDTIRSDGSSSFTSLKLDDSSLSEGVRYQELLEWLMSHIVPRGILSGVRYQEAPESTGTVVSLLPVSAGDDLLSPIRKSNTRVYESAFLSQAQEELDDLDEYIRELGAPPLPQEILDLARNLIEKIIREMPRYYSISPGENGEISIQTADKHKNGIMLLCGPNKEVSCYVSIDGKRRRAHYDSGSDLPDAFILEALSELDSSDA